LGYREGYLVGIRRPSTYSYPPKFNKLEDVENYTKRLYAELLENDSRGEEITARATDKDLKELIVRPEWYGAKGDGVKDDTAAIQGAINYCLSTSYPKALVLSGKYKLTSSVNIDRSASESVTHPNTDFRIIGLGNSSGFYVSTAINMFSSTLTPDSPGMPISEFVTFEGVYFEGSSASLGAHVLNGDMFLRMKFMNCRFYQMNLLSTDQYVQSIYLHNNTIWGATGVFLDCAGAYDVTFDGNKIEVMGTTFKSVSTTNYTDGCRFVNNEVEACSASPIIGTGFSGILIAGNYFEANSGGPQLDFSGGVLNNRGISVSGNLFLLTAAQIADPVYYAIEWGSTVAAFSSGNFCDGQLHGTSGMGSGISYFTPLGDVALNLPCPNENLWLFGTVPELGLKDTTSGKTYGLQTLATGIFTIRNPDTNVRFFSINPDGSVGIGPGNNTSAMPFCVYNTDGPEIGILDTGVNGIPWGIRSLAGGDLTIRNFNSGSRYFTIVGSGVSEGNVGINDAIPDEKLDVDGNINTTGVIKVDDVQVLGAQGAAVADATNGTDVITRLNDLLAILRTHGIIDTA
jgi:hypothetical protein